jgi:DNA-nicking Smr family endonuclease
MGKKESKHNNSEGAALFRDAVGDAQPLAARARHAPRNVPAGKQPKQQRDRQAPAKEVFNSPPETPKSELNDTMSFQRGSITRKTVRELRRGKYPIQDEIDLHGCTRPEAKAALAEFVSHCEQHGLSCIRVIHGKGMRSGPDGPVLKSAVSQWLQEWDAVLAFCPARPSDGGTGAVYVLLRN